jgi:hypothetical protein
VSKKGVFLALRHSSVHLASKFVKYSYAIWPIKKACMPISKSFEKMQKVDPKRFDFVQAGKRVGKTM